MNKEHIKNLVAEALGDEYRVTIKDSLLANDTACTYLILQKKEGMDSSMIPLKKIPSSISDQVIAENIVAVYKRDLDGNIKPSSLDEVREFEEIKDQILPRIIGKKTSPKFLSMYPHRDFLDLAIMYVIRLDDKGEKSIKVSNQRLAEWGVSEKELYKAAMANVSRLAPSRRMTLTAILGNVFGSGPIPPEMDSFEVIKTDALFGATSAFLDTRALQEFAKKYQKDSILVIPSSVHELLAFKEDFDPKNARGMVGEVNTSTVSPEDVLSGSIYRYHVKNDTFSIEKGGLAA